MEYTTVKEEVEADFVERRSRFIGRIAPVTTEEEAMAFIARIRQQCWDATHNVYAYLLREGQARRYSDDGEPQGTAGTPVLEVLEREGLTDAAIVVTRYFGGVLLGAGGLIRAYSHAAKLAVDAASRRRMVLCKQLTVSADYSFYGPICSLLPRFDALTEDAVFAEDVTLLIHVDADQVSLLRAELVELSNGRAKIHESGENYKELNKK